MIPNYVKPFLWSYKTERMDLEKDKKRIIANILNLGSEKATDWLFKRYSKKEIKNTFADTSLGEWNKKSLNYWSIIFGLKPKKIKRIQ